MTVKRVCPYPVGEIRMSVSATDPATIWPNTSWERIQDAFLVAAGATYTAGTSGGSATHTLTTGELPAHKHQVPAHGHAHTITATTPQFTHSITQPAFSVTGGAGTNNITGGGHVHTIGMTRDSSKTSGHYGEYTPTETQTSVMKATGYGAGDTTSTTHTHSLPAHTHTCSRTTNVAVGAHAATACTMSGGVTDKAAFDTESSGGGSAFSTLPPYLSVYVWKRVA